MIYKIDNFYNTLYPEDYLCVESDAMGINQLLNALKGLADGVDDPLRLMDFQDSFLLSYLETIGFVNVKEEYASILDDYPIFRYQNGEEVVKKHTKVLPERVLYTVDLNCLLEDTDEDGWR